MYIYVTPALKKTKNHYCRKSAAATTGGRGRALSGGSGDGGGVWCCETRIDGADVFRASLRAPSDTASASSAKSSAASR